MKDLLYLNDYHLPVFSAEKPENLTDVKWNILHRQVCDFIKRGVDNNVLKRIAGEQNARILWNKIEELYAHKSLSSKLRLLKRLKSLKYRDGTCMMDHVSEFLGIINELAFWGTKFDDETQGLWLLCSLPDSWEVFRMALCNSAPNDIITFDVVRNKLLQAETFKKMQSLSLEGSALKTESRGMNTNKSVERRQNSRSKSRGRYDNVTCYHCGKKGHIRRFCRRLKRDYE